MRLTLRIENHATLPNGQPLIQVLDRTGLQIGRAAYVDWQLPDAQRLISSEHATIQFRDGGYVLRDLSRNGTYLNGARIDTPNREARLGNGDRIAIGQYELSVALAGDDPQLAPIDNATAPSSDVWGGKADWGGAPPEPVETIEARTPMGHSASMDRVFDAPMAQQNRPSASVWDTSSWSGDATTQDGPPPAPSPVPEPAPPPQPAFPQSGYPEDAFGASSAPPPAPPRPEPARPPAPAAAPVAPLAAGDTANAMLRGMGVGGGADARAIEQAGGTLRVLVEGLHQLLKRHGEMKAELGIERTTIRRADNNFFKFATSPEDALQRILLPQEGDLPGPAAAQRAFDDIELHEGRLVKAMNDAVRRIVERFSPQEFKRRETGGVMSSIIPGSRKSAWWDELEREHAKLLDDNGAKLDEIIEDELRSAFGRHL